MKALARTVFLMAGLLLTVSPVIAFLMFAYGVGEPPRATPLEFAVFALPLLPGVALGGGLVLVGLPKLVAGKTRPRTRVAAGLLLVVSTVAHLALGFDGTVTAIIGPLAIVLNAAAFLLFVYPAKAFSFAQRETHA